MSPPRESLPSIAPAALAAIARLAPPRLIKKLDGAPDVAGSWVFVQDGNSFAVTTDGGERVSIAIQDGAVQSADALGCSCLLSPKCFHILAVASYLPIGTNDALDAQAPCSAAIATIDPTAEAIPAELEPERREVARAALAALATILDSGVSAMGAVARAELLRSVHAARVHGLHRLANRALAVAESARALRERSPSFELEQVVHAMGDATLTAHRLAHGVASLEVIGVARRAYEEVGAKRLVGIACEPVVTRSGYAGVVTYVADENGELFTVQDVAPGDAGRALASYRATVRLGEASLTHGDLSRKGLFVQGATASLDRRLGAGARVSAVSASGAAFDEAPIASLFAVPFAKQLARTLAASVETERPPMLLFLDGVLAGATPGGVLFVMDGAGAEPTILTLAMPSSDDAFACNENLRLLRAAHGTRLRVVGKIARRPKVIELLAIGSVDGSLSLSTESMGRVQVAFDMLGRGQLRGDASALDVSTVACAAAEATSASGDPVSSIERRVGRMVLGGRRSLTTRASRDVAVEAAALGNALLPTMRRALEELLASAATSGRSAGTQQRLLDSWLRAYVVTTSVRRTLASAAWGVA